MFIEVRSDLWMLIAKFSPKHAVADVATAIYWHITNVKC